jgi:ABC-2 type transport system permease protein
VFAILFLSDSPQPAWASSPVFLFLWLCFMSLHPFMALGGTEILLSAGESGLFFSASRNTLFLIPVFDRDGELQNLMLPQPWLVYTIQAILLSALLVAASIRMLRPINDRPRRRRK